MKYKILLIILGILFASSFLGAQEDETPPSVSVAAEPPEVIETWQNTEAFAFVSCNDKESGCDEESYKLKIFDENPETCPEIYDEYSFCNDTPCNEENPEIISSHQWVCATAKDNARNIGFSEPLEFKVDTTFPEGKIVAPLEVKINESFEIKVEAEDDNQMESICIKEENEIDWTCYSCPEEKTCQFAFEKKISTLGKYKYFGYLKDIAQNTNFTEPEYLEVFAVEKPKVATFSAEFQKDKAILKGYLISLGGSESVKVFFEWGETEDYGNQTPYFSKSVTGIFETTIAGFSPRKVYHFRAVAENIAGKSFGNDLLTTELIKNGGFETGNLEGWEEIGEPLGKREASKEDVKEGNFSGLFGFKEGINKKDGKSGLFEEIFLPEEAAGIKLSLNYKFYTTDKCDYDFLNIYLEDENGEILKSFLNYCCQDCTGLQTYGWNEINDDLTNFGGKKIRLIFEVENRSDQYRRSWAFIDKISLSFTPTVPPEVITKPATGIETNQAVLNGKLIDMGEAGSVEMWFVWDFIPHPNWQNYSNKTNSIFLNSPSSFSVSVGNLSSGTTFHFRIVAKNQAGTSTGSDLQFTTKYSAAGGWISPNNHKDPNNMWFNELKAYDASYNPNYLATYTTNNGSTATGYRGWLYFTLPGPVRSNKIRINADYWSSHVDMDIEILLNGIWTTLLHRGAVKDCQWTEFGYPEGIVTEARVRYYYKVWGWHFWIYEFQFYKVSDEPITPPAGNTLEATSIEENSAILHGQVSEDGRELTEVRFQYGKTSGYKLNTPWMKGPGGIGWASGKKFGKFISGLEKGVTYHFRAQIRNSAGIASGADKTFFTQLAPSGWVSPQGFIDPTGKWENEDYAFDDEIATYTRSQRALGDSVWSEYLYLTRKEIFSDKIRFRARELIEVDLVKVDVYRNGNWINVYYGTFPDYQWVVASFASGKVNQARIRFHSRYSNHYFYYHLYELDFWKIASSPSVLTISTEAGDIKENKAKLKGKLLDLGGASEAEVWFVFDQKFYPNPENYLFKTPKMKMTKPGDFEYIVSGLTPSTLYHFRAVASNVAGTSFGEDKTFTTLGTCIPGQTKTCISEQGCPHNIFCPSSGYWPPCPRDECQKNAKSIPECPCPTPPPGFTGPKYGNCTEACTCEISTEPGGACEWKIENQPPKAEIECENPDCIGFYKSPFFLKNKSTDPDGLEDIKKSEWDILNWKSLPDLTCPGTCDFLLPILDPGKYKVSLKVIDSKDATASTIKEIQIKKDIRADFLCSQDNKNWQSCLGFSVPFAKETRVYFKDKSEPSEGAKKIVKREWHFEDGEPKMIADNEENPSTIFQKPGKKNVMLRVTDDQGRVAWTSYFIDVSLPLPLWKEVPPTF